MSRWYSLKIKNELLFWFLALSLLPLVILAILNGVNLNKEFYGIEKNSLLKILEEKVSKIENHAKSLQNFIELGAVAPITHQTINKFGGKWYDEFFTDEFVEGYYEDFTEKGKFYDILLIDLEGNIVYSFKKERDYKTNLINGAYNQTNLAKTFKETISTLNVQISPFEFYPPSNDQAAFIAAPIYQNGQIAGAIAGQIDFEYFKNLLVVSLGFGKTGEIIASAIDENENIMAIFPLRKSKNENEKYVFDKRLKSPNVLASQGQRGSGEIVDYAGDEVLAAWDYAPTMRWGVVAKTDKDEALAAVYKLNFYYALAICLVGLGIIFVIFLVVSKIIKPVDILNKNAKDIALGKFDEIENIELENEIGELFQTFNSMASSLKESQEAIKKYNLQLEEKVAQRTADLEESKQSLRASNAKLQRYIDIIDKNINTSSTDLSGKIKYVSEAFCKASGYSKDELIGKPHSIIRHQDTKNEVFADLWKTILSGKVWRGEIKNMRKDGSSMWNNLTIEPNYEDGKMVGFTSFREDITDKKTIEQISITDKLTSLFNRRHLDFVLNEEVEKSQRYSTLTFSVLILDIDHFKNVNDTFGHDVGDLTLIRFAKIIKENIRSTDIAGRWGGEEFLVIAPQTGEMEAFEMGEKIRLAIQSSTFEAIEHITCSIGVSEFFKGATAIEILKNADKALYEAKNSGRNKTISQKKLIQGEKNNE